MTRRFEVVGLDVALDGNEARVFPAFPAIRLLPGHIAMVRFSEWGRNDERGLTDIGDIPEALERVGTPLSEPYPLVAEREILVLCGPAYWTAWKAIDGAAESALRWGEIDRGFRCAPASSSFLDALTARITTVAKETFDKQFSLHNPREPKGSGLLDAALLVLEGNSAAPLDVRYLRKLAAARINGDLDRFGRVLQIAADRLGRSEADLRAQVDDYFLVLARRARRDSLSPGRRRPAVTAGWAQGHLPQEAGNESRSWLMRRLARAATAPLDGRSLGTDLAARVKLGRWSENDVAVFWSAFARPLPESAATPEQVKVLATIYLDAVREYAEGMTVAWRRREPAARTIAGVQEMRKHAVSLQSRAKRTYVLGVDQFPESRSLAIVLERACGAGGFGLNLFRTEALQYGSAIAVNDAAPAAQITLRNVLTVAEKDPARASQELFSHAGYYVYCADSFLTSVSRDSHAPRHVRDVAEQVLRGADLSSLACASRCWLALRGITQRPEAKEFAYLFDRMTDMAARLDAPPRNDVFAVQSNTFDHHFEDFCRGAGVPVFMGGSVHSRLLERWFCQPLRLRRLLSPADFREIAPGEVPAKNVVVFSRRDVRAPEQEQIRRLFRSAWGILAAAARGAGGDGQEAAAADVLRGVMADLTEVQEGAIKLLDRRWSIVTHLDDMAALVLEDNISPELLPRERRGEELGDRRTTAPSAAPPSREDRMADVVDFRKR